jgi:outer membrane biogenesis lipoprotein LolB
LKRLLLIPFILILFGLTAQAQQSRNTPLQEQQSKVVIRSYPNPATSFITLEFEKNYERGYTIQIYNFLGRKMLESVNVNQRTTVQLTDFTRGVYIYQLRDRTGKTIESGKFQVSK